MKKLTASVFLPLALSLLLAACNSGTGLDGTYKGAGEFTFKPDGTVSTVMFGNRIETTYRVDGDKVKFHFPGGSDMVLTKTTDGNLSAGMLGTFVKKQ